MIPTITWFNIPADDTGRARAFYKKVFAWKVEPFPGMEQAGTFEISTGGIGGEILLRSHTGEPITVFIGVSSVDDYATRAAGSGGRIVIQKTAVPGRGYFAICEDTEQNRFGLWEDDPRAG
ncbi:VOC family protein [Methanoculleus bourgensis]|jgi:predicted enzyme related to lactoylglutathione lyase|uniref:VOC family protein n=1 Tax=Methanoculleus bourgensis TaxID=83986 RepID=A0A7K4C1N1_9EURY|nr:MULTISPECIES: VOC family protein [Methanoculleus]MBT0732117.1 VOC family protein [Methanoculleus bourgensis]MDD3373627.1 VOC family protein [Methanoculleus bourgensis]NMA87961.1 VOC family protein [Methanoculleus bourgensis]NQS77666.1 VOC family protein [Methanoculleus bourgensis]SAI89001.1 hypothetical protein MBBA_2157 [Methanoculleus bourgensis]